MNPAHAHSTLMLLALFAAQGQAQDEESQDPPALVADATRLRRLYGWKPRFDDLHLIVRTAIDWERSLAARDAG